MFRDGNLQKAEGHLLPLPVNLHSSTAACLGQRSACSWTEVIARPAGLKFAFSLQFAGQVFSVFFSIPLSGRCLAVFWNGAGISTCR